MVRLFLFYVYCIDTPLLSFCFSFTIYLNPNSSPIYLLNIIYSEAPTSVSVSFLYFRWLNYFDGLLFSLYCFWQNIIKQNQRFGEHKRDSWGKQRKFVYFCYWSGLRIFSPTFITILQFYIETAIISFTSGNDSKVKI